LTNEKVPQNEAESNQGGNSILFDLLKGDGFRVVCRPLEHAIGTGEASLYSELLGRRDYFKKRGQLDEEGFFFNTVLDLQHGTALTDKRQRTIIKSLEEVGLIKTKLKDSPPKRYFKIIDDESILLKYLLKGKVIMDQLEAEKNTQKQRIEEDRLKKEGYFSAKNIKSSQGEEFNSSILADSNITKGKTNKNNANKNNEREDTLTLSATKNNNQIVEKVISHYTDLFTKANGISPVITKANRQTVAALVDKHSADLLLAAVEIHVNEPDRWTQERGSLLATLEHNLPGYILKMNQRANGAEEEKKRREYNQQILDKERQRDEELERERAAWEALPEEEKQRQREERKRFIEGLKQAANGTQ